MANRILVVDDDAQLAQLMRISLETRDYEVIIARNGIEGLERARSDKPDLVVMDVMMPEMDGFEALQKMKSDESIRHIPVIMLTARGRSADAVKGIEAGAHFYLAKPFSTFELIAHVKQILEDARPVGQESPVPYQGEEISAEARRAESPKRPAPVRLASPASRESKADTSSSDESFAQILQRLDRIEQMLQVLMAAKSDAERQNK
jgi:DNA-binding response OmpR family regulator